LVNEFSQGISALKKSDYSKGVFYFRVALNKHKESKVARAKCMAYLGLCEVLGGLDEKISLIEEAHQINPTDTNILRVLSYAHLYLGQRQKGLAAIILGLKIEPENPELFNFLERVGYRQKSVISTLDRSNRINQFLGRFFRKAKKVVTVENVLPAAA
jgi:tetratricopeptide (TPR) repeat protein